MTMTDANLIKMLNEDLQNEYRHMMYYLRAASAVEGLHRPELREFFLKEAHEELGHVHEFMDILSYLGWVPTISDVYLGSVPHNPYDILQHVVKMEQEVA